MRVGVLFICITLFSLTGAFAMQSKCNFCSEANADFYDAQLSVQSMPASFIDSNDLIFVASEIDLKDDTKLPSVAEDKEIKALPSISGNIDGLLELINDTDNIEAFTQDKIDLLANFRNGDDVVVPLGFLLYINKKF
jgi:hypothetical protein